MTQEKQKMAAPAGRRRARSHAGHAIVENVLSIGLALLLVFLIRSSFIEAFKIPSGSMIPTLLVGDHIFVNKLAYGFKLPFTDMLMNSPVTLIPRQGPKRGDIIVFKYPRDESLYYIKRVIGTPGDTVEVRNKQLFINGQATSRTLLSKADSDAIFTSLTKTNYALDQLEIYHENLGNTNPTIMLDRNPMQGDFFGPRKIAPDEYFVMGDNRDYSNDSRFWGTVPLKNVRGKAMFIWLSAWFSLSGDQPHSFRPERIGTILH